MDQDERPVYDTEARKPAAMTTGLKSILIQENRRSHRQNEG